MKTRAQYAESGNIYFHFFIYSSIQISDQKITYTFQQCGLNGHITQRQSLRTSDTLCRSINVFWKKQSNAIVSVQSSRLRLEYCCVTKPLQRRHCYSTQNCCCTMYSVCVEIIVILKCYHRRLKSSSQSHDVTAQRIPWRRCIASLSLSFIRLNVTSL